MLTHGHYQKGHVQSSPQSVAAGTKPPESWGWPPAGAPSPPPRPAPSFGGPRLAGQRTRICRPCHRALRGDALGPERCSANVFAGGGGRDAPIRRERSASERAPPGDHLDSILFAWKPRGGWVPAAGWGSSQRGTDETVRLEHRETVLAAPGRHPCRNKSLSRLPAQPASL